MTAAFEWDETVVGHHTPEGFVEADHDEEELEEEKTGQRRFERGYNA